jgi:nanoRNase/pAp phosphatase (c-di-AMP/oligoRNAs hydrolase)
MDLTPKQQTSEAIRQSETILVTTGQHPSVDQVAAVIALTAILRKFGKKVSAVISDSLPQAVNLLDVASVERNLGGMRDFVLKVDTSRAEVGGLRYEPVDSKLNIFLTPAKGNFAPSDVTFDYGEASFEYDLAIVLGVPTRARIDKVYEQNLSLFEQIPVINLDFHRSNENYGAVNLIEPNASSLCEMLVALSESLQSGIIDEQIATALLMGIVGSTDRFTASHTTSKSLTVAAQMMAAGAKQQAVVRALYREGRGEQGRGGERGERSGNNDRAQREHREPGGQREQGSQGHQGRDSQPQREREPRPERERQAQPQPQAAQAVQPQPQPVQAAQPQAQPQAAPVMPEAAVAQAQPEAAPQAMNAQPAQDTRPFRSQEAELPIIEPGHIELSAPEPGMPEAAAGSEAVMQPYSAADFAAATETLQRQPNDQPAGNPSQG